MAKRSTPAATGRLRGEAAAHRHVEIVQADGGAIEHFRMDTAIAEAVFEVSVAEGIDAAAVVAEAVQAHVADPEAELTPAEARDRITVLEERLARYQALCQGEIEAADFADMPYFRVVGRVLCVLTVHRGLPSASGSDVFWVFLRELPEQLEFSHRQTLLGNTQPDVIRQPGLANIYKRLRRLVAKRYATTTSTTAAGNQQGYVLTEDGRLVFDGWPEVPGLRNQGDTPLRRQNRDGVRGRNSTGIGGRRRG